MLEAMAIRLTRVRARVQAACERSGRSADDVTLVAVSKRQPLELLQLVREAGQRVLGESQVQEAEAKAAAISGIEWHMVGPLQSNKAQRAARLFDVIHSVDRIKVAKILDKEASRLGRCLDAFVQINLGQEESKRGFPLGSLEENVRPLARMQSLRIVGLMAIPPVESRAEDARKWFRLLREQRDRFHDWPEWVEFPGKLSMGMSGDFEVAVEEGATHVRVGTGIFGNRLPVAK